MHSGRVAADLIGCWHWPVWWLPLCVDIYFIYPAAEISRLLQCKCIHITLANINTHNCMQTQCVYTHIYTQTHTCTWVPAATGVCCGGCCRLLRDNEKRASGETEGEYWGRWTWPLRCLGEKGREPRRYLWIYNEPPLYGCLCVRKYCWGLVSELQKGQCAVGTRTHLAVCPPSTEMYVLEPRASCFSVDTRCTAVMSHFCTHTVEYVSLLSTWATGLLNSASDSGTLR